MPACSFSFLFFVFLWPPDWCGALALGGGPEKEKRKKEPLELCVCIHDHDLTTHKFLSLVLCSDRGQVLMVVYSHTKLTGRDLMDNS